LGPYGTQLRKNIYDAWWKFFVQKQPNIVGIDGALLMHPGVREASGHVA
jgi:glycyl-tRNA synthetase